MKRIALYGKGGIGKSTTAVNLALTFAKQGKKIGLIGCDPKHDTCRLLLAKRLPTVMEEFVKLQSGESTLEDVVGDEGNIRCVELGGPRPGVGCAGRGIILGLEYLERNQFFQGLDMVLYDILGDVVCGGFAAPITRGYVQDVYVVTSGEHAALFAANNIIGGMLAIDASVQGLIFNARGFAQEELVIEKYSSAVNTPIVGRIDYSLNIPQWELKGKPIVAGIPDGVEARQYQELAERMLTGTSNFTPSPMNDDTILEGLL